MSVAFSRAPIPVIVQQHAEECAMLRHVRSVLVRAPHVRIHQLRRLDERIAAHLDGLVVAGDYGASLCMAALERPGAGEIFACAALALERRDHGTLGRLLSLAAVLPDAKRGLLSAFGWASADLLKGEVAPMLASGDPLRRELGLGACRLHGVDPGPPLTAALRNEDAGLRIEALRSTAALGRVDLIDLTRDAHRDNEPQVRRHAAITATVLGDRGTMLRCLMETAQQEAADNSVELALALQASEFDAARQLVRALAPGATAGPSRRLMRACGLLGDAQRVPWLIGLMNDDRVARLAGEAFSMITGADLAALDLERKPPQDFMSGPSDDAEEADVALDDDESLPWPDQDRVQCWWRSVADKVPVGQRLFLGQAPSIECARQALREGFQRQRITAARWCCLLAPGTQLFATAAPAWRQQRRLAAPI
jgi:uncharacterized protein (TIGR02270 family)